ncbi:MAG TPA: hypothetical protein VFD69_21460 [Vicinamibacterales bacterium]|nr:hypothetical protein [Vicinamibacterales bacterium]
MNVQLLRVVRLVIRVDSDPARQALFARLVHAHRPVRLAFKLHERIAGSWASALLISCYGFASFLRVARPRTRGARVLMVATHANARQQVARIAGWIGPADCAWVRTGAGALLTRSVFSGTALLLSRRRVVESLRIIRWLDRQYGFLVSCRAAGAIAWYSRSKGILAAARPAAILVSSDSHPEEMGFALAARTLGIPQIFVAHAYPTAITPALDFTLSILEGEAAVDARRLKGPIKGAVVLAGVEGDSHAMDATRLLRPNPAIGIFPPKAISWVTLAALVEDCRTYYRARRIVIRWHPSMLEPPRLTRLFDDVSDIVETPRHGTVQDAAHQCDWVIGDENSNVHLPVMKMGIPTIAVRDLGVYSESRSDQYGFVAAGVVHPPLAAIRDLDPQAAVSFFTTCWATRFARYDAAYFKSQDGVGADVRAATRALIEPAGEHGR